MAKFKSTKELMAARNPLIRTPVTPVDIYTPPAQVEAEKPKATQEAINSDSNKENDTSKEPAPPIAAPKKKDLVRKYSTYLYSSQIKGIRLRAVEHDVNDFAIVQEAIDEYFQKHPL
jgi:hypothetical protein